MSFASGESLLKFGFVLNKGEEEFYSWLIIYESNYFIKDLISIGYETQISYYKTTSSNNLEFEKNIYPINFFFNSKIKLLKKGSLRPYVGAGLGILTNIIEHPQKFEFQKFNAFHIITGINIGRHTATALQIELRLLNSNQEGSKTKFLITAGLKY